MSEISKEYIESITQEEFEAAGYEVYGADGGVRVDFPDGELRFIIFDTDDDEADYQRAVKVTREHYAPRKLLAEVQARNAALESLLREAYNERGFTVTYANDIVTDYLMPIEWLERVKNLLGEAHEPD